MSILNIDTSFVNVSVGPYIIDEFWVNSKGFLTAGTGDTIALPGLYDQGASVLSCSLVAPGNTGMVNLLGDKTVSVTATGNAAPGIVLYSALGTGVSAPSGGLGSTLPQDSWLQLSVNAYAGATASALTAAPVGLVVKWTKLTETQRAF